VIHDLWTIQEPRPGTTFGAFPPALSSILTRRGINDEESYRRFVAPSISDLHDPAEIHGIDYACDRIARAIRDREAIVIYGDYDVDGVTSIVLLQTVLKSLGADAGFVVPRRLVDGYGLKMEVLDRVLSDRDVRLVVTVDCGITSVEPVRRAIDRGIDVIITDHHLPPGTLPSAAAVLNPKQPGCTYPFKDLAGVGVVFKLCCELIRRAGKQLSIDSLLKIAAIGTVADVAPLVGENRTIVSLGLAGLADVRNPGLRALLRRLNLAGRPLRAVDVGFKIGPRINAAGRLASADTAIELFAARTEESAWEICAELDRMNAERQQIEKVVRASAEEQIAGGERVLILAGEGWHRGVLGLTAGRIAQRHHRPTLVMTIEDETCVGSGRSLPTIDLHGMLSGVADLFEHFGGHEFACGFSLPRRNLEALRERLHHDFALLEEEKFRKEALVDATITFGDLEPAFVSAHELLQPFGAGNPQPLFMVQGVRLRGSRTFAEDCHELELEDGSGRARGVLWSSASHLRDAIGAGLTDLLVKVEPDRYSGFRLEIIDARGASESRP
jgi:single-stranded-DNA-specific exonuclease